MKYILPIILFYVTAIHFCVRAYFIERARHFVYGKATEVNYYKWEVRGVVGIYFLPYLTLFWNDLFITGVMFFISVLIALLRSREHISPKFLD